MLMHTIYKCVQRLYHDLGEFITEVQRCFKIR